MSEHRGRLGYLARLVSSGGGISGPPASTGRQNGLKVRFRGVADLDLSLD